MGKQWKQWRTLFGGTPKSLQMVTAAMKVKDACLLLGRKARKSLVKWSENCSVVSDSLRPHGLYIPWNSPGQNTGVGSLSLLQGIVPTQGSNTGLPHCRRILYQLSHQGSPRMLEWVSYPFSSGSSRPKNWIRVPCIAGGFFLPTELSGKPTFYIISQLFITSNPIKWIILISSSDGWRHREVG